MTSRIRRFFQSLSTGEKSAIALGSLGALGVWLWNVSLPDLYKGRVCCDSVQYVDIANIHGLWDVITHAGIRTLGFPLFLKVHHLLLPQSLWLSGALLTTLLLHLGSSLFLYFSLKSRNVLIHPFFLLLLLAHPGLSSHAAVPLTDSFTTSLCSLALAFSVRGNVVGLGITTGYLLLTRPSLQPVFLLYLPLLAYTQKPKFNRVQIKTFAVSLLPFLAWGWAACAKQFGKFCWTAPGFAKAMGAGSIQMGFKVVRAYTSFSPRTTLSLVADPFSEQHIAASCSIGSGSVSLQLLACYAKNVLFLPVHLGKKIMGLFDNYALNSYAVEITTPLVRDFNRVFGLLGFVSFCVTLGWAVLKLENRSSPKSEPFFPLVIFAMVYTLVMMNFHVESRYEFPALPTFFLLMGIFANRWREAPKKLQWLSALTIGALGVIFWIQTAYWDTLPSTPMH